MSDDVSKAQAFCRAVAELAKKEGLNFFLVTDGASITRNSGSDAVNHARQAHKDWERKNGIDPDHDWNQDIVMKWGNK